MINSQHKDLPFAERVLKVLIFNLGAFPVRNGNFYMIIHCNRPIGNILDELHVHQKRPMRMQKVFVRCKFTAQYIHTSHTFQHLSVFQMKHQIPSNHFTI